MSKLTCACGHVIVDQAGALPYKAALIADGDQDRLWDGVAADVATYAAQPAAQDRRRWLAAYFPPPYPADATDVEAVHDIVTAAALPVRRTVYECESCGRLWLQEGPDSNRFRGYAPEEPGTGALRSVARTDERTDGHPHQTRRDGHG